MEEEKMGVWFVPKYSFQGYNVSVRIVEEDGGGCKVLLEPAPNKYVINEDDYISLLGLDLDRDFPFWHEGVLIEKSAKYELVFKKPNPSDKYKKIALTYHEAIEFMKRMTGFKIV